MFELLDKKNQFTRFGFYFSAILIIISIFILTYLYFYNSSFEHLQPMPTPDKLSSQVPDGEDYLYPVYGLNDICTPRGLVPSHVNKLCLKRDNTYKPLSNCQCEDKDGYCAICYPEVKIDRKGRSVIYNPAKIES